MSNSSTENKLNHLNAQEWLKFTKTWFMHNPPPRKKNELLHPAKYPENMVAEFIKFFTKENQVVFDPFLGTGSTLVACHHTNRNGIGIELQKKYAQIAEERLKVLEQQWKLDVPAENKENSEGARLHCKQVVICGNSSLLEKYWQEYNLPQIDFVITSPPYGPMLQKKALAAKKREQEGFDTLYSTDTNDLGNAESYQEFLQMLTDIFVKLKPMIKENGYVVVILQNYMDKGEYKTLAWDFAAEMKKHYRLRGERIWLQDNKTLYPYGYRYDFVPNVHHHYCLLLKKVQG